MSITSKEEVPTKPEEVGKGAVASVAVIHLSPRWVADLNGPHCKAGSWALFSLSWAGAGRKGGEGGKALTLPVATLRGHPG